jgi:uncharacterized membrane protein YidH (DUF202 family)
LRRDETNNHVLLCILPDLRLTLDRNVTVVNERMPRSGDNGQQWCLTDEEAQTAQSTVVPFNVFEVKLSGSGGMPTGLVEAQTDSTMQLATKFSKFTTGAAAFNTVKTLPYWAANPAFFSFFELNTQKTTSQLPSGQEDYSLMETMHISRSGGAAIAPMKPARIEPKTFFANERTFVQWVSASLLLLSISGYLLNSPIGNYAATAAAIALFSFVLVVYSTVLYFKRLNLLKAKEPYGYFNKSTPIALTSVVGLAIFLIWADSLKGSDFLQLFSMKEDGGRRMMRGSSFKPVVSGRRLRTEYENCPHDEVFGTKLFIDEQHPSSLVVDSKRDAFLVTSERSVYIQSVQRDGSTTAAESFKEQEILLSINESHLQGIAYVGDRLFAVSDGPKRTELIEMAWIGGGSTTSNEKLRVIGRWTLKDSRSQVDGFSFEPSADDSATNGSFLIHMDSSIHTYSVPGSSEEEDSPEQEPVRLNSLNMKVLTQGHEESSDRLSTMVTFESITYILKSDEAVLEAWNVRNGTLLSAIELPVADKEWTGFALERRGTRGTTEDALFLHMMTREPTSLGNSQIWSFPALENISHPSSEIFSVPQCQVTTISS